MFSEQLTGLTYGLGERSVAPAAYDTACVARVPSAEAPSSPAYPEAIQWLLAAQYGDGTWGGPVRYHHDRVVSTLASMVALAQWREAQGALADYSDRIDAAAWGLAPHLRALDRDPQETHGFCDIASELLGEARFYGIALPWQATGRLAARPRPTAARAEATLASAGRAAHPAASTMNSSPAAAAARLRRNPGDAATRRWLTGIVRAHAGAAPALPSIDLLESAWVLHSVALLHPGPQQAVDALAAPLATLERALAPAPPSGPAHVCVDLVTTALAFRVLTWAGRAPDPSLLLRFEQPEHFGSERGPSTLGHALLLQALRVAAPFAGRERAIRKVIGLLARSTTPDHCWLDRRHASPYFPTAHAVMALGPQLTLAEEAVHFMLETQRPDGSWGYFDSGTAEETAYCLQALSCFAAQGGHALIRPDALQAGARWLAAAPERGHGRHAPLWLGNSLYCPTRMVEASVLAALAMTI